MVPDPIHIFPPRLEYFDVSIIFQHLIIHFSPLHRYQLLWLCILNCIIRKPHIHSPDVSYFLCKSGLFLWFQHWSVRTRSLSCRLRQFQLPVRKNRAINTLLFSSRTVSSIWGQINSVESSYIFLSTYLHSTVEFRGVQLSRAFQHGHDQVPEVSRKLWMQIFNQVLEVEKNFKWLTTLTSWKLCGQVNLKDIGSSLHFTNNTSSRCLSVAHFSWMDLEPCLLLCL